MTLTLTKGNTMNAFDLRGVFPVFQTPFTDSEELDLPALEREINWIADQRAHGIVFGMVSEALRLTDAERKIVIQRAADAGAARGLPLIASIGGESTVIALARSRDAIEAGAAALMATPPLSGSHEERALEDYFRSILKHSSVPVVVQDSSGYLGQSLAIGLQAKLLAEFGPMVKFKPEAVPLRPTLEALEAATQGKAEVFEGMGGAALIDSFEAGVVGTMPGAEACWAIVAMWDALMGGDVSRAQRIHGPLARMIALQTTIDSFVVCEKFLLAEQGVIATATARSPLDFSLSAESQSNLRHLLLELKQAVA